LINHPKNLKVDKTTSLNHKLYLTASLTQNKISL
jgi:hypothetical protein